jgi:hypothetical protein
VAKGQLLMVIEWADYDNGGKWFEDSMEITANRSGYVDFKTDRPLYTDTGYKILAINANPPEADVRMLYQ